MLYKTNISCLHVVDVDVDELDYTKIINIKNIKLNHITNYFINKIQFSFFVIDFLK